MMDYLMIYLWTRLGAIQAVFIVILIISFLLLGLFIVTWLIGMVNDEWKDKEKEREDAVQVGKKMLIAIIISTLVLVILPSKKDALIIYIVPKIAKSEAAIDAIDIINKLPKVLQKQINEYLAVDEAEHD